MTAMVTSLIQTTSENKPAPRLIAFYLTQFYRTPENDLWWGKGFTEWTNVTKAKPLFAGHYQPHLPSDFGFYDLRVRETRREHIEVAKQYGIDGFCYHYYWFSGTRILNLPLDAMLADPESDMPFCLCWANENWTRRWDASDHEILIAQKHLPEDDLNFIKSLVPFFEDKRYIHIDGKPCLLVYRPQHLPDARKTVQIWREYCRLIGLGDIQICAALTHGNKDYAKFGFDSGIEFPPHNLQELVNINSSIKFFDAFQGNVMQYAAIAQSYLDRTYGNARVFKTVFPSWDNSARTGDRAVIVINAIPENYEYWLSSTIDKVQQSGEGDQLIFINAWNEWAEGCHLEPDRWFGHGFLQATLNAKKGLRRFTAFPKVDLPFTNETHHRTFWKDMTDVVHYHAWLKLGNLKLAVNRRPWLRRILVPLIRAVRACRARNGDEITAMRRSVLVSEVDCTNIEGQYFVPVSIVIVNYNAGSFLAKCVHSCLEHGRQVIVVDNASSDSSLKELTTSFPSENRLCVIRLNSNRGFAAGCNIGLSKATESYILFLNPDCVLGADSLQRMVKVLEADSRAGMVGGMLLNPDGTEQAGGRRAVPTPWRSFVRTFGLFRLRALSPRFFSDFLLYQQPLPDGPVEVESISGACMMVRRAVPKDIGPLDDGYFMHCEDLDWCMRFRQRGWKIMFVPNARVVHHQGMCSKTRPIFVEWHKHKGMMRFYRKFFRHRYPGVLLWIVGFGVWLRFSAIVINHSVGHLKRWAEA